MPTSKKKKISFNAFWKINKETFTKELPKDQIKNVKILMRNCYNAVGKKPDPFTSVEDLYNGHGPIYPKYISKELIAVIPKG